ncbi:TetR/AcrR family transcriptional regulator [Nocardia blacklockiae]|uniref:TetR/AcrR family transcriptional regulator n=1 Tax=Nocardia blacklockiae TaxID=480036 RepID=UPI001895D94B|nr:TetR/AcrR family transcriptional regulator [Nocardia blacklockiae]MBF6175034.1 TetR/AcrR family transcriptional regulator [Nocardia blacklockiae]
MGDSTRDRIISEALRLFGAQGYARTTVTQIEKAAGLSAGSGALYRHFRAKDELLIEAVRTRLGERGQWGPLLAEDFSITAWLDSLAPGASTVDKLTMLFGIGLNRLEHDRDVNRILLRDNSIDTAVLEVFRRDEYMVFVTAVLRGLLELAGPEGASQDWEATAAVLVGAIAHYWLISDTFGGQHPTQVDPERYLRATAEMVVARLHRAGAEEEGTP